MGSRGKRILDLVLNATNRERRDSSTSSDSSRGSNSISGPSFIEDSDDSVKDPDYAIEKRVTIEDSSNEEENTFVNDAELITPITTDNLTITSSENMTEASKKVHTTQLTTVNIPFKSIENIPFTLTEVATETVTSQPNIEDNPCTSIETTANLDTSTKKGKKRTANTDRWKRNITKKLRNSGKSYESPKTHKIVPKRKLKPPCKELCKFKCHDQFSVEERQKLLADYWNLGSIESQWLFIANSVQQVVPKFRYIRVDATGAQTRCGRNNNNAFYFTKSENKVKVCKVFFLNTLDINNRLIETALKKKNKVNNITLMKDNRGQHGKHVTIDEQIKVGVKLFIESIPKIESHYTRANSSRHYIDGSKTIADLHRDYVELCKQNSTQFVNYVMFYKIFTQEYNISFFIPKKDLCDTCDAYKNSTEEEKQVNVDKYETHQREKRLSREEKERDKANRNVIVAVYDLQAVFQCPKGDVSVFYYKSELNVLNLTVFNIQNSIVNCYVWDESNAKRGVNEIATCIFKYLDEISKSGTNLDIIFYSDNCAGQQKNKFMVSMYMFAVQKFTNIRSITHKYLIRGHTQNEGDSAHSQIERQVKRQLRSGPIYSPDGFIAAIKAARKTKDCFRVSEMCYDDFYDWKIVCSQMHITTNIKDEESNPVKITDIKVIKVLKDEPQFIYFKYSYADIEFKKAVIIKRKINNDIQIKKAYDEKPKIPPKKKEDLMELVNKNLIPRYYRAFYENL